MAAKASAKVFHPGFFRGLELRVIATTAVSSGPSIGLCRSDRIQPSSLPRRTLGTLGVFRRITLANIVACGDGADHNRLGNCGAPPLEGFRGVSSLLVLLVV
jgi:hypothetical protein